MITKDIGRVIGKHGFVCVCVCLCLWWLRLITVLLPEDLE